MPAIGDYSTSEQDTGFTWIDGKTIYKKTLHITDLPGTNASKEIAHGISEFGFLVSFNGIGYTGSWMAPVPQRFAGAMYSDRQLAIRVSTSVVAIASNTNGQPFSGVYLTLYYTKNS